MPHCAEMNKIPPNAQNISDAKSVTSMDDCYDMCVENGTSCGGWRLSVDKIDATKMQCMLYGSTPVSYTHLTLPTI